MLTLILATLLLQSDVVKKAELEEAEAVQAGKAVNWSAAGEAWLIAAKKQKSPVMQEKGLACLEKAWGLAENGEKEFLRTRLRNIAKYPTPFDKPGVSGTPQTWAEFGNNWGCSIEPRFGRTGPTSAKLIPAKEDEKQGLNGWSTLTSLRIPAAAGKSYNLTLWVLSVETDQPGEIGLQFRDAAGGKISKSVAPLTQDCPFWKKIELKCEAPAGTAALFIRLDLKITKGAMWVDDVSLTEGAKELVQNGSFEKR
jgi:hypothetical protein